MSDFKMPDISGLMQAAQKIQGDVARMQEELARTTCEASSGGGMVTATVNGAYDVVSIKIDNKYETGIVAKVNDNGTYKVHLDNDTVIGEWKPIQNCWKFHHDMTV